jgi:hypothetical protein
VTGLRRWHFWGPMHRRPSPQALPRRVPSSTAMCLKTEQPRAGAVGQPSREAVRFFRRATLRAGLFRGRTLTA